MEQTLLPIGSVVLLKQGTKKLMIYGRKQKLASNQNIYDYVGCLYPEGYLNPDYTYVFNHGDIAAVIFMGYKDEDEKIYVTKMEQLV
ncbi:DUF4176 domain-containing protein [Ectobacillus antri]|jgi:hypothetical protein|uniref:DUF4176 domain-containing protein n=1 Tax=Ectobacillus antri TaxID=2486280 RepID=A0ABT6H6X6_9BACI|nr:DUF4176 domain-containing protein [Ectobacillus antri]MDG4658011.1 DUF4176 domain-containing protein [Ectobacillus antri]MDG5755099.1 DUF4176 domain-containing protein [Ectobacillus antri]